MARAAPFIHDRPAAEARLLGEELADRIPLGLRQVLEEDGMLFTRYDVRAAR